MDPEVISKLEAVCRELGLDSSLAHRIVREAKPSTGKSEGPDCAPSDGECVRAERDRLLRMEAEIMQLLGSSSRESIVHDLRNLLNELILLQELGRSRT